MLVLERLVPVILDLHISASMDQISSVGPMVLIPTTCLHDQDQQAFFHAHGTLFKKRVQLICPSFATLLPSSIFDQPCVFFPFDSTFLSH